MATLVGQAGVDDVLTGFGGNTFAGLSGNDVMQGGAGNDQFDFDFGTLTGVASGVDIMIGYDGDDIYYVDDASDQVVEVSATGGIDTITANVSYTLSTNVEHLTLDVGALNGTGNGLDNTILGNSSDNILDGGQGDDYLDGGTGGNDTYVVTSAGDVIIEVGTPDTEIDTVVSSIAFDLSALGMGLIENLTLTGNGNISGFGNERSNTMIGNSGSNLLDAGATVDPLSLAAGFAADYLDGGGGADIMVGHNGDDIYVVDNAGDQAFELGGEGSDLIKSSITINMGNYDFVENLVLTGTKAINATANAAGNAMQGNVAANTLTGSAVSDILDGGGGNDRLVGGGGDDVYIVDSTGDVVVELAGGGTDTVTVFANFTLGANLENLTMAGAAVTGTGNNLSNVLVGNNLDNTLDGGANLAGIDTLSGGDGDDTYIVRNVGDFVDEILNQGSDTVRAGFTYTLTTFVENLVLTGTAAIDGTGNLFDNTITGNTAANTLDGAAGADTLLGGSGNDVYLVDDVNDVVTESASAGTDTVLSQVSFTLGDNVENLTLTGAIDIDGTGNASSNIIIGNAANNTLDGGGGADNLIGGDGDDYYIVSGTGSTITEGSGGATGIDTVESSVTITLSGNIENLVLTGSANINGTGDAGNNTITGNIGDNTLNGAVGADTMAGGAGDDTFIVDNAGDVVNENVAEGTDSVRSDVAYTLLAEVENLTLTTAAGAANGTGNASDNAITGNASVNVLTGLAGDDTLDGGGGADTMVGGLNDDTYFVDNAGDIVTEVAGQGTDTVNSNQTFDLSTSGANVENLTLTGTLAINGTGDAGDNTITGNSAINTLAGGAGNDTYFIGAGDVVIDLAGQGTDTVVTTATTSLSAFVGNEIENLTLGGAAAINGTGDGSNNVITGNTAKNILTGLGGDDTIDGGGSGDTMVGGLGNDLYIVDSTTDVVTEVAGQGTDEVQSSVTFTLTGDLENLTLTGTGNVSGTGNALVNVLNGNAGDNTLDGGLGDDFMIGGLGNDTYVVDSASDVVIDAGGTSDTIRSSLTVTLASYVGIENLVLTGTGNINGTGTAANNTLTGNGGVNTLTGGLGDDTYIMNSNDVAVEGVGEGTDTLIVTITSGTFVVPANFENIILVGNGNIGLTGGAGSDTLTGNNGNNTLDGGAGADFLTGGKGLDVFIVDNSGDTVLENPGEGTDTVRSSVSYTLSANVENLVLTGTADIDATGNGGDNTLTGNSGSNTLDGGLGTDRLVGGLGDDSYIIDNNRDTIVDTGGHDTVYAPYSYTLAANLEDLVLTGTSDLNGTGNGVANVITGNDGDNVLTGLGGNDMLTGGDGDDSLVGGLGMDNMVGGDGDDNYFIDNAGDIVTDVTGDGSDLATITVSYVFDPTSEIEIILMGNTNPLNVMATDTDNFIIANVAANRISALDGDDLIFGGGGADSIDAGAGDDTISGGSGQDTIRGGAGADYFFIDMTSPVISDIIQDFNVVTDNDVLDISDFLSAYDPLTDVLTDFVRIIDSGANSLVQVDANGATTPGGFVTVAILQGITGLTGEAALVASGNLIVS
jgi:Ca2+-binding RTX toxin-like protein